ncbi:MAG: hypothetical protein KJI71_01595 [Patescibacteria group bacterium]|nr:hypothetical protein [Patescibacteria group bacterium]
MSSMSEKPAKDRILELLRDNSSKNFTYGAIAEELELSKTNIGKIINPMAKEGQLLVKKVGNQKIVKSMASSSGDQGSSSIHSSSTEKEKDVDLTEDREFNSGVTSSSGDQGSSSIHSSSTEKDKITVPEHIRIAWKDLGPSIASAFSKRKWPTKHKMFTIFDNWMNELLN